MERKNVCVPREALRTWKHGVKACRKESAEVIVVGYADEGPNLNQRGPERSLNLRVPKSNRANSTETVRDCRRGKVGTKGVRNSEETVLSIAKN